MIDLEWWMVYRASAFLIWTFLVVWFAAKGRRINFLQTLGMALLWGLPASVGVLALIRICLTIKGIYG